MSVYDNDLPCDTIDVLSNEAVTTTDASISDSDVNPGVISNSDSDVNPGVNSNIDSGIIRNERRPRRAAAIHADLKRRILGD